MEVLSKIISLLMVVVLLFILPLDYLLGHQNVIMDDYVESELIGFVDQMREEGCIKIDTYEKFIDRLYVTGMNFDIELEHAVLKEGNSFSAVEELPGVLLASANVNELPYGNTDSDEVRSFANHTHTADCYAGHNHLASGCTDGYVCHDGALYTDTSSSYPGHEQYDLKCSTCNKQIIRFTVDYYDTNTNYFIWTLRWSSYSNTYEITQSNYFIDRNQSTEDIGNSSVYTLYQKLRYGTLPMNAKTLYKNSPEFNYYAQQYPDTSWITSVKPPTCQLPNDPTPICNQVVTSLTATNPVQTVDLGNSIVTTAIATYLDGHTGTVSCSGNFNPNVIGTQTVTLTYSGLVGNAKTSGTRTCTTNVTVRANFIPASLTVTPSSYTVYHGQEPTYSVLVKYTSGSSKVITSGFIKSGWSSGPGVKALTFSYTENGVTVTAGLTITVKPNLVSITVSPSSQIVERYTDPTYSVRAYYEDGSNKWVTGLSVTGYDKTIIGNQNITVTYTENSVSRSSAVTVMVTPLKRICPTCGNSYFLNNNDFDTGCPICKITAAYIQVSPDDVTISRGEPLNITVTATFLDGHTEAVMGWTSNFDPYRLGLQLVMVVFQGKFTYVSVMVVSTKACSICGYTYSLNEDGTDPGCPICKAALLSISASPEYQSVNQGDDISLTVTGAYRDGHTEELQDWYSNYDKDRAGEQLVTVYYNNLSCNVTVEVFSALNITCPVCGTVYNLREYSWGCPECADTLTGIEATLQNGGIQVSYGEELDLRVVLTYRDGHRAMAFGGWTDTFDPNTMGSQAVIVSYRDRFGNTLSDTLTVEVSDKLMKKVCENGHVYDTEDPLAECPYCAAGGIIQEQYYSMNFTDEILDKLYTDGIYHMNTGDYITVKVILRTKGSIYSFSPFHKKKDTLPVTFGGEVA